MKYLTISLSPEIMAMKPADFRKWFEKKFPENNWEQVWTDHGGKLPIKKEPASGKKGG